MILSKSLGMIPSWQYDQAWAQNPKYNNHVQFPQGWNQLTPQPVGPYYAPPPELGLGRLNGLGITDTWATRLTIGGAVIAGLAAIAGLFIAMKR